MSRAPSFATVILDVDSTVSGIEGVDWLARRRSDDVAAKVASLTDEAMRGAIALEQVYGARLGLVRPRRDDIDALSRAYISAVAAGCADAIKRMRDAGVRVMLVSGGLRPALVPLAEHIGVDPHDLHAVSVHFDSSGDYAGFDTSSPLATAAGKRTLVEFLEPVGPVIAVGDGSTDLAMQPVVDRFVGFTGFVRRDVVVQQADALVDSFDELIEIVFSHASSNQITEL
jgi:phosphoserine phosphatase